jgi:nitroreductase
MQTDLYQAILARRSVRRYETQRLDEAALVQVREAIAAATSLVPGNRLEVLLQDVLPDEDLVATLGAYGRIVAPPHYLVPAIEGEEHALEDLGYRVQQIAVRLTALGIGTCYVGSLGRESEVRARFQLPDGARVGAFLIFGRPSAALGGRLVNRVMRGVAGATNKLPVERIFFLDSFDVPATPPVEIAPLLEAARNAPSAANTQPWRFLWHRGHLFLFVKRRNLRFDVASSHQYRFFDGGICMANVALALEALAREGRWQMLDEGERGLPDYPESLQPLARLLL